MSSSQWGVAALTLGAIGVENAIPILLDAIRIPYRRGRWAAPLALQRIGTTAALTGLSDALRDKNCDLRESIAYALSEIGNPAAVPALVDMLSDTADRSWNGRSAAAYALGRIGDRAAVPALIDAMTAELTQVRESAARALGILGDTRAVPHLIELLTDLAYNGWSSEKGPVCVCDEAAAALEKLGTDQALDALRRWPIRLLSLLDVEDANIRMIAIIKLGRLGDPVAVPRLIECLKDTTIVGSLGRVSIHDAAVDALSRVRSFAEPAS